jgi:hypothetical protein
MHVELIKQLEQRGASLGLKPSDLWEMAGIDRTVWQRWRRGVRDPGLPNYLKIEALKGKLDQLQAPKPRKRKRDS